MPEFPVAVEHGAYRSKKGRRYGNRHYALLSGVQYSASDKRHFLRVLRAHGLRRLAWIEVGSEREAWNRLTVAGLREIAKETAA